MKRRSVIAVILAGMMALGSAQGLTVNAAISDEDFYYQEVQNYSSYLDDKNADAQAAVDVDLFSYDVESSEVEETTLDEKKALLIKNGNALTVDVNIPSDGYYQLQLGYYPIEGASSSIKFELSIDGSVPFAGASTLTLRRVWQENQTYEEDSQGNQIRVSAVQKPMWCSALLEDSSGMTEEPYRFFLTEGTHTLTFDVYQNDLALNEIKLIQPISRPSYAELSKSYEQSDVKGFEKSFEAEHADLKSDRSIVIQSDKGSPSVSPSSETQIRYNSIGGDSWKTVGEWVEWTIEVPEDGLYTLSMHYKQDTKSGDVSMRKLYIDGEIPFKEAESICFPYSSWDMITLGDKEGPYQFFLSKGTHTLRLEATLGTAASHLQAVDEALTELNQIYMDVVMVTGPDPDVNRDYQFEKSIPDVIERMAAMSERLKQIEVGIEELTGETGGQSAAAIERLYVALDKMVKDPETISKRLKNFNTDVTSLATWCNDSRLQPLQLDYIKVSSEDKVSKEGSNIFEVLWYHVKQFFHSFFVDYGNVGNKEVKSDKEILVWIGSGRDQADIIRSLINEDFAPNHDFGVNVQLVNTSALLPATLSGIGPDVYLSIAEATPVDYALRHAVVDLTQFEDCDEVLERFYPEALTSFKLDDGVYALPETMSYPMLFYRKDILTNLGINKEDLETWDGVLQTVLPELDMNSFDFGVQGTLNNYVSMLYQNGGRVYTEDGTASALNSAEAIAAFELLTSLYTDYGTPVSYDFANRFRSGQMPLAVMDYTNYNQLSLFAPEIDGCWEMLPLPGMTDADGGLNRTAVCTVTGSVILSESEYIDESWEFLKWWTSAEVQSRYASELESVVGTGARYATANVEAMQSVEWSKVTKASLNEQMQSVVGMPHIAGSYYTTRSFEFAFRDVVYNGDNLRESLAEASESITNEITEKRKEFYTEGGK